MVINVTYLFSTFDICAQHHNQSIRWLIVIIDNDDGPQEGDLSIFVGPSKGLAVGHRMAVTIALDSELIRRTEG